MRYADKSRNTTMHKLIVLMAVFMVSACSLPLSFIPINIIIDFPEEELEGALDKLEREIRTEKKTPPEEHDRNQNWDFAPRPFVPVRYEDQDKDEKDIDIDVSTPQIKDLKKKREDRFSKLKPHFQAGRLGEKNDGTIDVVNEKNMEGMDAKERAAMKKLVREENDDRGALIKEIARANNIPEDRVNKVKKVFARVMKKHAEKGWWIQDDKGDWKKKEE